MLRDFYLFMFCTVSLLRGKVKGLQSIRAIFQGNVPIGPREGQKFAAADSAVLYERRSLHTWSKRDADAETALDRMHEAQLSTLSGDLRADARSQTL